MWKRIKRIKDQNLSLKQYHNEEKIQVSPWKFKQVDDMFTKPLRKFVVEVQRNVKDLNKW